jgi:hypothetical protein
MENTLDPTQIFTVIYETGSTLSKLSGKNLGHKNYETFLTAHEIL